MSFFVHRTIMMIHQFQGRARCLMVPELCLTDSYFCSFDFHIGRVNHIRFGESIERLHEVTVLGKLLRSENVQANQACDSGSFCRGFSTTALATCFSFQISLFDSVQFIVCGIHM